MTDQEKEFFVRELAVLLAAKGATVSPPAVEGYWMVLRELSLADFRGVVAGALRDPEDGIKLNPGKLLAMAPTATGHTQAWSEIRAEIRAGHCGNDARVSQRHHVAVKIMGGWHQLGQSDAATLDRRAYDFREAWDAAGHKVAHHERQHPTDARQITGTVAPNVRPCAPSAKLIEQWPNGVDATIEDFRANYHARFTEWSIANRAYETAKGEWDAAHPAPAPSGEVYAPGMSYAKDRSWFGEVTKKFLSKWASETSIEERTERAWRNLGHLSRSELLAAFTGWNTVAFPDRAPTINDLLDRVDGGHDRMGRNAQMKSAATVVR